MFSGVPILECFLDEAFGSGNISTVVGEAAVILNNTGGGIDFDTTCCVFDPNAVGEYSDRTGNQGAPLVTSFTVTSLSDLRLYEPRTFPRLYYFWTRNSSYCLPCSNQ